MYIIIRTEKYIDLHYDIIDNQGKAIHTLKESLNTKFEKEIVGLQ